MLLSSSLFIIIFIVFAVIVSITIFKFCLMYFDLKQRNSVYNNYDKIGHIYDTAREYAYRKVFREDIFTHISSGYKLNSDEMSIVQKKYIETVFNMIGEEVKEDLILLHGDLYNLAYFLANDFFERIISDEVYTSHFAEQQNKSVNVLHKPGGLT